MKATNLLPFSALSLVMLAAPFAGHAQPVAYAVNAPLDFGSCGMQLQQHTNGTPIYVSLGFTATNLTETLYLDTVAQTARQTGSVPLLPLTATVSFQEGQLINAFPPPGVYVTGYVTINLSIGTLTFDTGNRPYGWNDSANAYTFDSSFQNSFYVYGNYTLVTTGYPLHGDFSFPMNPILPLPAYALYDFNAWSTTGDTNYITLSGTNTLASQCFYYGPYGLLADVRTADHFHLELAVNHGYLGWTIPTPAVGRVPTPPTITLQPQSQTVSAHTNVAFTVSAASTPPLSYQWRFNRIGITGASNSSLTISNTVPENLGNYDVVVFNTDGSVTSSNAVLSMYPYLAVPFAGAVTFWGKPAALSVEAWGTGPLSYQWYKDSAAVLKGTQPTLSFASMQFSNAGMYSVVVSSPLGSVTNAPAQVVVNPAGVSLGLYGSYPGVTIDGVVGYNYIIQRSPDLSNTNAWTTMTNLTLTQSLELWVDTSLDTTLPANRYRFYRVLPAR